MILPLSAPVIAVITLYYAVEHWNSYFNALIYLTDRNLQPLQIVLREILIQNQTINMQSTEDIFNIVERARLAQTMKYSLIVIASVPMLLLYPFIQKYFVKGIMVGAIKG
jgi:ABC-type glycerol-3-phosphate transport system permease component